MCFFVSNKSTTNTLYTINVKDHLVVFESEEYSLHNVDPLHMNSIINKTNTLTSLDHCLSDSNSGLLILLLLGIHFSAVHF